MRIVSDCGLSRNLFIVSDVIVTVTCVSCRIRNRGIFPPKLPVFDYGVFYGMNPPFSTPDPLPRNMVGIGRFGKGRGRGSHISRSRPAWQQHFTKLVWN